MLANAVESNKTEKWAWSFGRVKESNERVTFAQRPEMSRESAKAMTLRQTHSWFEEKAYVAGVG